MPTDRIRQAIIQICAKPDPVRSARIADLARRASDAAETGRASLEPILDELEEVAGVRPPPSYWASFHGGSSPEEFAATVGTRMPDPLFDLTSGEIRALLALEARGRETGQYDEAENRRVMDYLYSCLGNACNSDVIYYYFMELDLDGLTAEVVRRQSILAEGGEAALDEYEVEACRNVLEECASSYATLRQAFQRLDIDERGKYRRKLQEVFERQVAKARAE